MGQTLPERVSARLVALAETRGFKTALAARMGYTQAGITPFTKGEREVSLSMLEAISDVAGIPVCELIAEPGTLHELNAYEASVVRALRTWPASVTQALSRFLQFFVDELPGGWRVAQPARVAARDAGDGSSSGLRVWVDEERASCSARARSTTI